MNRSKLADRLSDSQDLSNKNEDDEASHDGYLFEEFAAMYFNLNRYDLRKASNESRVGKRASNMFLCCSQAKINLKQNVMYLFLFEQIIIFLNPKAL